MATDGIARHREEFLSSGAAPVQVRDDVASSWLRSSVWSVRPETTEPPYRADLNPESALLRAAGPVLRAVQERLGELGISFLVSDRDGRIVDRRVQDNSLLSRLDRVNISPGHLFAEDAVGTNGIGTAIELGRTTRIDGHEHYIDVLVGFTCVGVPIVDPIQQRPAGVLDVTCSSDTANAMLDLIAEQTARAIEARLLEQHSASERALLDQFLMANRRTRSGLVVLSDRILMANPQASRLFNDLDHPLIWDHAAKALSASSAVEGHLALPDGRLVATRTSALRDGDEVIGSIMEIRIVAEARAGPVPLPRTPTRRPPGLQGTDRSFLHAYTAGLAALAERAVVVCGEAGVGKAALGRALLGDAVVLEGALATIDGEDGWLAELGEVLGARPPALLLLHIDLLPVDAIRRLVPMLRAAVGRGTRLVVTYTCGLVSDATVLPDLDAQRLRLAPLRDRLADLPALVAARLGERRVAPEVVQLFLRLPWPGNVRELNAVLRQMLADAPRGTLGLGDVPAEVRRSAPRRPLTRFEQAEIHAVLDALAETHGNKREAAGVLGISRSTLYRKLQNAGIDLANTVF